MRHTLFLASVSLVALTACQPAENASEALQAEPAPVMAEDPVEEEVVAEETVEVTEETVAEGSDAAEAVEDTSAEDADHDHGDDHEDHTDDAGADDHDDHDHDHAGGEAHVHGKSDMAVSLDGNSVSISLEGALANFDTDESTREISDPTLYTNGVIALRGGDCTAEMTSALIRPIGDHGNLALDFVYTCAAIEDLTAIEVTAFSKFSGFEEVDAVILTETGQTAETLTGSNTVLDLP